MLCAVGSPAMNGANKAMSATAAMRIRPVHAPRSVSRTSSRIREEDNGPAATTRISELSAVAEEESGIGVSGIFDTGIKKAVAEIDQQVDHHDNQRKHNQARLNQVVVALCDRPDEQFSETGTVEYSLGEDGAAKDSAGIQAHCRDDGDQNIAQRMLEIDLARHKTFGKSGTNVILAEHFQHRRSRQAGDVGRLHESQTQRREGKFMQILADRRATHRMDHGKPSKPD